MKEFFEEMKEILSDKNDDYSNRRNFFSNFETIALYGTKADLGICIRLGDKVARAASFLREKEFKVEDEKLKDTLIDTANYALIAYSYIDGKRSVVDFVESLEGRDFSSLKNKALFYSSQLGINPLEYSINNLIFSFDRVFSLYNNDYMLDNCECNSRKMAELLRLALTALTALSFLERFYIKTITGRKDVKIRMESRNATL